MKLRRGFLFFMAGMIAAFFALLPRRVGLALGRTLGALSFSMLRSRARIAVENLALIYGDVMDPERRARLARANFAHQGAMLAECLHFVGRPRELDRFLQVENVALLHAAMAEGRGVVAFSGHLGNFLLMGSAVARVCDFRFLFRDPSDPDVSAVYRWLLRRLGIPVIQDNPRNVCALQCVEHLRRGGAVGSLIDQVEAGGIVVDFMGQPAGSSWGMAKLAMSRKTPLLSIFCIRRPDTTLRIFVAGSLEAAPEGAEGARLKALVSEMNAVLGEQVMAAPEQWFWGHRRWRRWRK